MITFSKIKFMGRLGNQLFQYAAIKSAALNCNDNCVISSNHNLLKYFQIHCDTIDYEYLQELINKLNIYKESVFNYEYRFLEIQPNTSLFGYFQSEKYFLKYKDIIRDNFQFIDNILDAAKDHIEKYKNNQIVSLHVRRGDYLKNTNFHPQCTKEYYESALNFFDQTNTTILVFSDDIEWCRNEFSSYKNFIYSPFTDPGYDLCLMSLCDHNIIANSTFSWWGAWLNTNLDKKVIAPKKWFGESFNVNTNDLYPNSWKVI